MHLMVSVVIPTYNRASLVRNSIESALGQTFRDLEVIVVDDGSTDGTGEIVRREYGERIRYFYQPNQGQSVAFNSGIEKARGEYIAFLASDDVWLPEKIEWQLKALNQFGPKYGACYTDARFMNSSTDTKTVFQFAKQRYEGEMGIVPDVIRVLLEPHPMTPIWVQTLVAHADLVRQIGGFEPKLRFGEDDEFLFRLGKVTGFCYVNSPLTKIDRRPALDRHTEVNEDWDRVEFRLEQSQFRYEKRWSLSEGMPSDVRRAIRRELRSVHSAWANWYLETGQYSRAREAVSKAASYDLTFNLALKWVMTRLVPRLAYTVVRVGAGRNERPKA